MNRYSQYTPSQFNPLTRDEIFTVPLAKQAQHDKAQASLDELGLFDIKRLDVDDELATGYINDFTDQINQEIDTISKSGINNQSIGKIKSLARQRDKWLKQGDGKKIEANYNGYVANKAELQKAYEKGDISADKYNLGLQQALNDYKGVAEGGSFNPFVAAKDTDYNKIALDAAKAVPIQERHEFLLKNGYQLSDDGSTYFHGDTNRKFTKEGAIASIVANQLTTNDKVISDLRQQEKLGLLGEGVTAQDKILSIALNLEKNLSVDSVDRDLKISGNKGFNGNGSGNGNNPNPNDPSYEFREAKSVQTRHNDLSSRLGDVLSGKKIKPPLMGTGIGTNITILPNLLFNAFTDNGKPTELDEYQNEYNSLVERLELGGHKFDTLPDLLKIEDTSKILRAAEKGEEVKLDATSQQVFDTYTLLKSQGKLPEGATVFSPETATAISDYNKQKAVKEYLDNRKDLSYQNVFETTGLITTYDRIGSKIKSSNPKQLFEGVRLNKNSRVFAYEDKGELINFSDLTKEDQDAINAGGGSVSGVYSPKNFLSLQFKDSEGSTDKRVLAGMMEIVLPDSGKTILVSRSEDEMNTDSYRAAVNFNDIYDDSGNLNEKPIGYLDNEDALYEVIKQLHDPNYKLNN